MNETLIKRWIAFTGLSLPLLLCLRDWSLLPSMSASYYTPARDIFVGGLAVIGGALGCFQGHDARDRRAAMIASVTAMGVAGFPMAPDNATGWPFWCGWLHFACALLFFGALASMCGRLFVLTDSPTPTPQKLKRNAVYRGCAMTIVVGVAALAVVAIAFDHSPAVFWIEAAMVEAFGLAFLVKSGFIKSLNDPERITP